MTEGTCPICGQAGHTKHQFGDQYPLWYRVLGGIYYLGYWPYAKITCKVKGHEFIQNINGMPLPVPLPFCFRCGKENKELRWI